MKSRTSILAIAMTLLAALALPGQLAAQHTRYKLVDLGTLGGRFGQAYAVSNSQVVGWASTTGNSPHAFSWTQAGGMVDLGTLGGTYSEAMAVSNGQVAGYVNTTGNGEFHAVVWIAQATPTPTSARA